jgi:5-methylcytosine-specific restriction endonuclease McrA
VRNKKTPYRKRRNTNWAQKQRMRAMVRDNFKCRMGGCEEATLYKLTIHHLVPLSEGGTHYLENLVTVCKECHTLIHAWPGGPEMFRLAMSEVETEGV